MMFFILCASFLFGLALVVLAFVAAFRLQSWNSTQHIINAEWLDEAGRFALISRWGA